MEAAFKSRVEHAFGALLGSSTQSGSGSRLASADASSSLARGANGAADPWSVREVAVPCNQGSRLADESSGSESDEPSCAARYERFVKLADRRRKRRTIEDDEAFNGEDEWDEGRMGKRPRGSELEEATSTADGEPDFEEDESREVRMMVGMDQTLDFEEEEDEYDKVAVGREGASERMYMREIKGTSGADSSTIVPLAEPGVPRGAPGRDSRANHAAAAARLKEDDRNAKAVNVDVAKMLASARTSGSTKITNSPGLITSVDVNFISTGLSSPGDDMKNSSKGKSVTNGILKPSSGRRTSNVAGEGKDSSSGVRDLEPTLPEQREVPKAGGSSVKKSKTKVVRFAVEDHVIQDEPVPRKETENVSTPQDFAKEGMSNKDVERVLSRTSTRNNSSRVPDYVRNPSKYTHYTLDWSDEEDDNKANVAAFQATWTMTHPPQNQEMESLRELPKSITFTPRGASASNTRGGDPKPSTASGGHQSQGLLSFSEEAEVDDSSGVAVTEPSEAKAPRLFRKRARNEADDNNVEDATL